jgi:hypothetical protein
MRHRSSSASSIHTLTSSAAHDDGRYLRLPCPLGTLSVSPGLWCTAPFRSLLVLGLPTSSSMWCVHATHGHGLTVPHSPRVRGRGIESSALISCVLELVEIVSMGSCSRSTVGVAATECLPAPAAEPIADDALTLGIGRVEVAAAGVGAELGADEGLASSLVDGEVGSTGLDDDVESSDSWRAETSHTVQAALL